jgi:hypothetical protein
VSDENPEPAEQYDDPEAIEAARSGKGGAGSKWRERSAIGAVMVGIAKGFQSVFEPKEKEKPAIIQEADDPEKDDGPYSVSMDADHPEKTIITFKAPEPDDNDDQ